MSSQATEKLRRIWLPALPVLRKDLTEAASRKRTYVLRVLYALTLFAFFAFFYAEQVQRWGSSPGRLLGRGRDFFEFTLAAQFLGVFLFLPAVMSGVFTREKERDSLGMLFLTDLTPREILFEKYLSGLATLFLLKFILGWREWMTSFHYLDWYRHPLFGFLYSFQCLFFFLPMIAWVSFWIGMKVRSRHRALMATIIVFAAWNALPVAVMMMANAQGFRAIWRVKSFLVFSPVAHVVAAEFSPDAFGRSHLSVLVFNLVWHGGIYHIFKDLCMQHSDKLLGRVATPGRSDR